MTCFSCFCKRKGVSRATQTTEVDDEVSWAQNTCSYTYRELRMATDNFNPANKVGEGGFGSVYKGMLKDGTMAAVKRETIGFWSMAILRITALHKHFLVEAIAISNSIGLQGAKYALELHEGLHSFTRKSSHILFIGILKQVMFSLMTNSNPRFQTLVLQNCSQPT